MKSKVFFLALILTVMTFAVLRPSSAEEIYPAAILSFEERGTGLSGQGANVADLLFASLIQNPKLLIVERTKLDDILTEAELNLSGIVSSEQAIQIGQVTGARLIITGSIFKVDKTTHIVAKIISTETSKVLGEKVSGTDPLDVLVGQLAKGIDTAVNESAADLVPPAPDRDMVIAQLKQVVEGRTLPPVTVFVSETHLGREIPDPAAETELMHIYKEVGGQVFDATADDVDPGTYRITGEGFSEFAIRIKNLVSVKARLEVKVADPDGNIVVADCETAVKVDLNEIMAGKAALQEAAAQIAQRMIPQMAQ